MSEERKKELIDKLASYVVDMEDETIADLAQTYQSVHYTIIGIISFIEVSLG